MAPGVSAADPDWKVRVIDAEGADAVLVVGVVSIALGVGWPGSATTGLEPRVTPGVGLRALINWSTDGSAAWAALATARPKPAIIMVAYSFRGILNPLFVTY
jgi:hypothetical protein